MSKEREDDTSIVMKKTYDRANYGSIWIATIREALQHHSNQEDSKFIRTVESLEKCGE